MKFILPVLFIISISISVLMNGCNSTSSSDGGTAILFGQVYDTTQTTLILISGATVVLNEANLTTFTNDSGIFRFDNLGSGEYTCTVSKSGYVPYTSKVVVEPDDTTTVYISMIFKNIFVYKSLILDRYNAANLLSGLVVDDNNSRNKDIQIRDSVVGADTLIFIRSAGLDSIYGGPGGYSTYFSYNFAGTYTNIEFDSLAKYNTPDGFINPYRDFPVQFGVDGLINQNNTNSKTVRAFYLAGRYNSIAPRVYGLLFIDSAWYDASLGLRRIRVNAKINVKEQNMFNPNLKK